MPERRKKGRRKSDRLLDVIRINELIGEDQNGAAAARSLVKKVLWERAKGDLYAIAECCSEERTSDYCVELLSRVAKCVESMDFIMYEWEKEENAWD
jgi:hypothetical protein